MVRPLGAQDRPWVRIGAQAIPAFERADRVPGGSGLDEIRVVQPAVFLHAGVGRLRLAGVLNLEGATMSEGELAPGNWGEGFIDRRHPHTYVHELILTADDLLGRHDGAARVSLSAGKGFAPFGTDDPMVRPFIRYPVNHHLAQVLERAVAIAALRLSRVTVEAGLFNGDEPERPSQWPRIGGRFGDSWSGRVSVSLVPGGSLQGSYAHVQSPEHRPGAGPDQAKWSLSARWSRPRTRGPAWRPSYGLIEWARTSEGGGFFVFHSVLAEGAWSSGPHRLQYRFERTERPEEERVARFRSLRPHLENAILGTTRWTVHTIGYDVRVPRRVTGPVSVRPLVEIAYARITKVGGGLFDVNGLYGRGHIWSVTIGMRLAAGMTMHRMGRYGAAEDEDGMMTHEHDGMMP